MERCTGKITDWLIKCGAIPETDRELYEYAIYSILLSLSPMLLALAIGALFGSAVQGVLTITPFVILRKFSGGYHANVAFRAKCKIFSRHLQKPILKTEKGRFKGL